ncbi:MAG TPA: Ig-like domain-containing protein [Croceibacterium sp.]|nr:Ig-like domain-containing protein [Croceibacterium sp.]
MSNDTIYGTSGNDTLSGGNGVDTIHGGDGDDIISGGNGVDTLFGDAGNDKLYGDNGADNLTGGAGDDLLDGLNGFDVAYYSGLIGEYSFLAAAGYLHIIHQGGAGADGHDQVIRVEQLVFADRIIDLTGNTDNAPVAADDHVSVGEDAGTYSSGSGSVLDNDFDFEGDPLTVTGTTLTGTYGTLTINADGTYSYALSASAQALAEGELVEDSFNYTVSDGNSTDTGALVFHVAGANDAPVANPDAATTGENDVALIDVLANDTDIDNNSVLAVLATSAPPGQGAATVVGNQVEYDPGTDFEALAVGQSEAVAVSYTIGDEHGATASATVTVTVTGANDGPVANPDSGGTSENATLLVDVLANDTDIDNGAVLTVTAASAPAGQGHASIVGNQVQFDPGSDFDDLAVGESETVVVSYDMQDEHGAGSSSTVTITVTGTNDTPVANPDTRTIGENTAIVVDVLANDTDADHEPVLVVTSASVPAGQGTVTIVENQVRFDPGSDFDHLENGETAVVVVDYTIDDEHGAQSSSSITLTIQGRTEATANTGTNDGETLVGTPGDDTIDALGGDDTVFGLAGNDTLSGGDGSDALHGEEDDDVLEGGNDRDFLYGGDGHDQLLGQAANDTLEGGEGDDQLSGGDGFDDLHGDGGNDDLQGGNDDDFLLGGEGNDQLQGEAGLDSLFGEIGDDQLTGGAGNDALDGGEGNDVLDGGDGEDFLADFLGANSLAGGLGHDQIIASSSGGIQTIDGGDGNDTIRHYYRESASTITTGTGSDTIELAHVNVGTAAIVVSDFTPGAGGDVVRLSGDDGSLLGLLTGWDGSSNPFGSGFLRLQQSGADTVLEWDHDGDTGGSSFETLVVFQNTTAGDFTEANFFPAYPPDGSAPAGETITGTADSESLTGTVGDDTIDGLAGEDTIFGLAGADIINGGDGFDYLSGDADDDVIDGGNDDDFLLGGEGNDQTLGQAGSDSLLGEAGNDQLTGGAGNDSLDGGDGDDALDAGEGDDFLSDVGGTNSLVGGLGNDFIVAASSGGIQTINGGDGNDTVIHYYRDSASTITTGTGSDTIELAHANLGAAAITVTDFTPGAGGDVFRLGGDDGSLLSLLSGWDGSSNPFDTGFVRLQQSGADTLLEWDQDGDAGGSAFETLVVFQNTTAGDFTDANFAPGYDPDGSAPAGRSIIGTSEDDTLAGTIGGDTIDALGGNDFVTGGAGADVIYGRDGSDLLTGEADDDVIEGGTEDDFAWGGDGSDQLLGQDGNDLLFGENGGDQLTGGAGNDGLEGGDGDDSLTGGDGDDFLAGGLGADMLSGGLGTDIFDFRSASEGPDEVTDFVGGGDLIRVWADGFGGGLVSGGAVTLVSGSDPTASDETGQFLFDTDDGSLLWDADGTGTADAVLVATFSNVPTLTATDFFVN